MGTKGEKMNYKYTEIMDFLRYEIDREVHKDKLPSIRALAIKFSCSNSTVIKAYNELESLGLVFSAPKSGYYINKSNKTDEKDLDFYSGVPDSFHLPIANLKKIMQIVLQEDNPVLFNYSYPKGYDLLREFILMDLNQDDIELDSVFITPGAQGAFNVILESKKDQDEILIEDPSYNIFITHLNKKKISYKKIHRDYSGIDLESFEEILKTSSIKYFYTMSRNHNPLGDSLTIEQMEKIIALSRTYDFYIVEDDYLEEFSKGPTFFSLAQDRTLYIRSYSKTISPALRLAHLIVPKNLVKDLTDTVTYLNYGASLIHQSVLLKYLKSEYYLRDMVNEKNRIKQNIMIFKNAIIDFPFPYHLPEAGFFASIEFPKDFKLKLLMENLESKGFRFRDFRGFTSNEDRKAMRISLSRVSPNAMNLAIKELTAQTLSMREEKDDVNKIYI